jgi:hypothetical protein
MYNIHIRNGLLPAIGGGTLIFGGNDGDDPGDPGDPGGFPDHHGHGLFPGDHGGGDDGGGFDGGHFADGGSVGHGGGHFGGGGHLAGGGHFTGGGASGVHGALPFTGFDSVKLALISIMLVVFGLLLMRIVMVISSDR